ncbi:MAG: DUF1801 domain-containing protein [Bacteroidota bacterium]
MPMNPHPQFASFLAAYSPEIQQLTLELRAFITDTIPEANELIWDNYNALATAYSKSEKLTDAFCHLSVYGKYVNIGFNRGVELTRPVVKLEGTGKLIRHVRVTDIKDFPREEIREMIYEAMGIADMRNPALAEKETPGISKVMSVSEKKRRPAQP